MSSESSDILEEKVPTKMIVLLNCLNNCQKYNAKSFLKLMSYFLTKSLRVRKLAFYEPPLIV